MCPLPIYETIKAKFVNVKVEGLKTSELRFDVAENLYEPLPGLSNAVIDVDLELSTRRRPRPR